MLTVSIYFFGSVILNDCNNSRLFAFLFIIVFLFVLSLLKFRFVVDKIFAFVFPIAVGITKCVWIAQPITNSIGILQVGAGLYVNMMDIILLYFAFRSVNYKRKNKNPLSISIILFFFSILLSCMFANKIEFALAGLFLYLKCFVLYSFFSVYPEFDRIQKPLLLGVYCSLTFQGIVSTLQMINNGPIGLQALGESESAMRYRLVDGIIQRSPAGLFDHSSNLAIFSIFALLITFFCEKNKTIKFVVLSIGLYLLLIAAARTVIVALIIVLFYGLWKYRKRLLKLKYALSFVVGIALAFIAFVVMIKENMLDFFTNSDFIYQIGDRFSQWNLALSYIFKRWGIIGYGINNYTSVTTETGNSSFIYLNPVHNNYLLYWFELGIIGLLLYIIIFVCCYRYGKNFKKLKQIKKTGLLFVACVFLYNFAGWSFATSMSIYLFWSALGFVDQESKEI